MTQQYIELNTAEKEIQKLNPSGPDNFQSIGTLPSHQ